jgi:hypothetical protein
MLEFEHRKFAEIVGPAHSHVERGTLSMKGSVYDRGTANGAYSEHRRWPKGVKANTAGSFTIVDVNGGTTPVVLAAGETLLCRWRSFTDSALTHGSSTLDNFVIIWD